MYIGYWTLNKYIISLPQHWNDVLHTSSRWETDAVIKHVTDIEISCEKSKLVSLRYPPKTEFVYAYF